MDGIPLAGLGVGSGWAIVALFVIWLFRGTVVTGAEHKRALGEKDRQIERSEALNREQRILLDQLTEQNGILLESAVPTVNAVMSALHRAAGGDGR